jgi:hypothetical protein
MIIRDDEASGFLDRVFGAIIACIFSILTFFLAPILLVAKYWEEASIFKYLGARFMLHKLFHAPFFIWILIVSVLAIFYGAYSGTLRTITMLSHLWGTSGDDELTVKIWTIFIIGFVVSLFLMA